MEGIFLPAIAWRLPEKRPPEMAPVKAANPAPTTTGAAAIWSEEFLLLGDDAYFWFWRDGAVNALAGESIAAANTRPIAEIIFACLFPLAFLRFDVSRRYIAMGDVSFFQNRINFVSLRRACMVSEVV
eukprot:scaffold7642_cov54-Attheya_sp.AAC.1